jgi:hydrogenase/urease accessory protein HupE
MKKRFYYAVISLLITAMTIGTACAHLGSVGSGTITISPEKITLLLAMPAYLFNEADQNGDRLLQPQEIQQGRAAIIRRLEQLVDLRLDGERGELLDDQIIVSIHVDNQNSTPQIEWLRQVRFSPEASSGGLHLAIAPEVLSINYLVQARRDIEAEVAIFSVNETEHTFFKTAGDTLKSFFVEGIAHIFLGYDHVLFILTLLISGIHFRRWLWLLSAFTLAHATTYTLASLDYVVVSATLVESIIAFSIILVALIRIAGCKPSLYWEIPAIFSLGLFHGLGFASAIAALFKASRFPITSIIGFNLGIEIGQVIIACLLGLLLFCLQKRPRLTQAITGTILASAVVLGSYWLFQQLKSVDDGWRLADAIQIHLPIALPSNSPSQSDLFAEFLKHGAENVQTDRATQPPLPVPSDPFKEKLQQR